MAEDDATIENGPDPTRLNDAECDEVFDRLFPQGFAAPDILREIAPHGWAKSPLVRVFHPTLEQVFQELTDFHENLESLRRPDQAAEAPPTLEDAKTSWESLSKTVRPERECTELVGMCVWDIFSNNHEVLAPDGRLVDLGSWRSAGAYVAERLNREIRGDRRYDYLDFYMGASRYSSRADLSAVYRMIFQRMHSLGLDWVYHFPPLGVITLRDPLEDDAAIGDYDPSQAIQREEERRRDAEELAQLEAHLEEDYRESVKEARESDPPPTVQAYCDEYGLLPRGWPPEA